MTETVDIQQQNQEHLEQLAFVLQNRSKPTVVLITYDIPQKRKDIYERLKRQLPDNRFVDLNLESVSVTSLINAFKTHLSESVLEKAGPNCLINVFGLENSLVDLNEGQLQKSSLVANMNFERELYFREMPFTTVLWTDRYFLDQLGQNAPDLWGWINYEFSFYTPESELDQKSIPYQERLPKRGKIPDRKARIDELETRLAQLPVNDQSDRTLKERITTLRLLGEEYRQHFEFDKAVQRLKIALFIAEAVNDYGIYAHLHFVLGDVLFDKKDFIGAEQQYLTSLTFSGSLEDSKNIANTYHQLGIVYQEQRKWLEALEHYENAIEWKTKTSNELEVGSTYHQIGMVYQKQRKWTQALEHYQKAIEWKTKVGNEFEVGDTYQQMGKIYDEQRKWSEALEFYQKAVEWNTKTGNEFELGANYQHIGKIYEINGDYKEAERYYKKAREWAVKFQNKHELAKIDESLKRIKEVKSGINYAF